MRGICCNKVRFQIESGFCSVNTGLDTRKYLKIGKNSLSDKSENYSEVLKQLESDHDRKSVADKEMQYC
jgi:murein endopeptidase